MLGAIFAVAHNRVMQVAHVHPYLIFPAGVELQLHKRVAVGALECLVASYCELSFSGVVGRKHLKL